jgi:hypothetical protein
LELRQRSGIQATTQSGNGGNITLETRDLLLLRNNGLELRNPLTPLSDITASSQLGIDGI